MIYLLRDIRVFQYKISSLSLQRSVAKISKRSQTVDVLIAHYTCYMHYYSTHKFSSLNENFLKQLSQT